jgi:nucleotide-binding universal stress UspA family protein
MSKTYLIGVDDSEDSMRTIRYAAAKVAQTNTAIHIIHVLEWSPYSFLTPEELEERHKRRGEELKRAETAVIEPILNELADSKDVVSEVRYGNIAEVIAKYGKEISADQVFVGRSGNNPLSTRLFGSVPSTLIQISDIPVTVVP